MLKHHSKDLTKSLKEFSYNLKKDFKFKIKKNGISEFSRYLISLSKALE